MSERPAELETGELVGERWQVSHRLGGGDLGDVYEVYDVAAKNGVTEPRALKLLPPTVLKNPNEWARFRSESRALGDNLGSVGVHVVDVDVSEATGAPYVVTEKIDAYTLSDIILGSGSWKPGELLNALVHLERGLGEAHACGLAHGDLRPENVFLTDEDPSNVRITDGGVGILRASLGGWSGPEGWCAPELTTPGIQATRQSDLYAVGLLAFFALTGKRAFAAADPLQPKALRTAMLAGLRSATARAAAVGAKVPLRLDRWFARALAPKPEDRFRTIREMVDEFASALGEKLPERAPAPAPEIRERPAEPAVEPQAKKVRANLPTVPEEPVPATEGESGIARVSSKPLLFDDALPKRTAWVDGKSSRAEAPAPELTSPATQKTQPGPEAQLGPSGGEPPRRQRVGSLDAADPLAATAMAVSPFAPQPDQDEASTKAETPEAAVAAPETRPESTETGSGGRTRSVTVPLPWLIGGGAAVLVTSVGAIVLALWALTSRSNTPKPEPRAVGGPTVSVPGTTAPVAPSEPAPPSEAESAAPSQEQAPPPEERSDQEDAPSQGVPAEPGEESGPSDSTPVPSDKARVTFTCAPVACTKVFCNAVEYDPSVPIDLRPGKNVCKAAAPGHRTNSVTLHLEPGEATSHEFPMVPKSSGGSTTRGSTRAKKPCGTFINPCR